MSQVTNPPSSIHDGQVKINTGNLVKPRWDASNLATDPLLNTFQQFIYAPPLGLSAAPTTQWPSNVVSPTDADIYDFANNTFLENGIPGQVHFWRIVFDYDKDNNTNVRLVVELENTSLVSGGFKLSNHIFSPGAVQAGQFNLLFVTIADANSLPPPNGIGQGYELRVQTDSNQFQNSAASFLEVNSVTRISLAHQPR